MKSALGELSRTLGPVKGENRGSAEKAGEQNIWSASRLFWGDLWGGARSSLRWKNWRGGGQNSKGRMKSINVGKHVRGNVLRASHVEKEVEEPDLALNDHLCRV